MSVEAASAKPRRASSRSPIWNRVHAASAWAADREAESVGVSRRKASTTRVASSLSSDASGERESSPTTRAAGGRSVLDQRARTRETAWDFARSASASSVRAADERLETKAYVPAPAARTTAEKSAITATFCRASLRRRRVKPVTGRASIGSPSRYRPRSVAMSAIEA